jgi:hypothetical protein
MVCIIDAEVDDDNADANEAIEANANVANR